jgi:hypothetical protein
MSKFHEHIGTYAFKYDKVIFDNALKASIELGAPTEELCTQLLGIGQSELVKLVRIYPMYGNYMDDLISDLDERCMEIAHRLLREPKTREYPVAYARRAIKSRFLDVPLSMQSLNEPRRSKVRNLAANKQTLQQVPLKSDTCSYTEDENLKNTWEILKQITKSNFEFSVIQLRARGYSESEIGDILNVHRLKIVRILKSLAIRYKKYSQENLK